MAGDWIKMRTNLQRNPRVIRILSALKADNCPQDVQKVSDRLRVVGALHAIWSLADEQTEDGRLDAYSYSTIDEMIGWPGFCKAVESVGWISQTAQGVEFPRFDEHNGASAKRRAQDSDRKRESRNRPQTVRETSASEADKKRTREDKRRSNTPIVPVGFDLFWQAYPRKVAKPDAMQAWRRIMPDAELSARILAALERARSTEQWQRDEGKFIPHPATWLNKRRFDDEIPQPAVKKVALG